MGGRWEKTGDGEGEERGEKTGDGSCAAPGPCARVPKMELNVLLPKAVRLWPQEQSGFWQDRRRAELLRFDR